MATVPARNCAGFLFELGSQSCLASTLGPSEEPGQLNVFTSQGREDDVPTPLDQSHGPQTAIPRIRRQNLIWLDRTASGTSRASECLW